MNDLRARFDAWMQVHDLTDDPATPAATVIVLRDDPDDGLEVLMLKRNASLGAFASMWVFPGGKVDPEDFAGGDDILAASQRAAVREAAEEADLVIDESTVVPFAHWMPPTVVPRRFATWFYATAAPAGTDGDVNIDGGEIVDHLWVTPAEALARQATGEVQLMPPTWITLDELANHATTAEALQALGDAEPQFFVTRRLESKPPIVCWHGDAAYESGDADAPGGRHRLTMAADGWVYEHDLAS